MIRNNYSTVKITYDTPKPINIDVVSIVPIGLYNVLNLIELQLLVKTYHGGKYVLKARYELEHTKHELEYLLTNILSTGNGLLGKRTIEVLTEDIEVLYTNFDILVYNDYSVLFCDKFNLTIPNSFVYPLKYLNWSIEHERIDTGTLFDLIISMDQKRENNADYMGISICDHLYLEVYKNCALWTANFYGDFPDVPIIKIGNKDELKAMIKRYKHNENMTDKRKITLPFDNIDDYYFSMPEIKAGQIYESNTTDVSMIRAYNSYYIYDLVISPTCNLQPIW